MRAWSLAVALSVAVACGGSLDDEAPAETGAARDQLRACGADDFCTSDEICIGTQGALCTPLPPPGESCPEGCVLTEHCCNCTAYACLAPPPSVCPDGPSCGCLDSSTDVRFLSTCLPPRRQCTDDNGGVDVLCITVALDEDPFADGGAR
jgi:hypothetical protein